MTHATPHRRLTTELRELSARLGVAIAPGESGGDQADAAVRPTPAPRLRAGVWAAGAAEEEAGVKASRVALLPELLSLKRRTLGISLRDAAAAAGVDHSTYYRAESGSNMPDAAVIIVLCRWLGVSVEYAVLGEEPRHTGCSRCVELEARLTRIRDVLSESSQ